jgi:ferredoxin
MKVKFLPQDVELDIEQGQTVMDLAHKNNIPIRSTCNGMPSCAECRVKVLDGDWNVNPPSRKELSLIGTGYYIDQRRLSCQMLCFGDITVDTTEQVEKSAEGPVTKKFLTKVHKESAAESHSLGGVMLEENNQLLQELQKDVPEAPVALTAASLDEGRKNKHRDRERGRNRGGSGQQNQRRDNNRAQQARGGQAGGQTRTNGGQFHNPAGNNIPSHAPHPQHVAGTASPEMSAGADVGGDRGDHGPGGSQRRRRRRGGRGRSRNRGGGGQGGGAQNSH